MAGSSSMEGVVLGAGGALAHMDALALERVQSLQHAYALREARGTPG